MGDRFKAEVFQSQHSCGNIAEVHAILTITATAPVAPRVKPERIFAVLCDVSGSMAGAKMEAAKGALSRWVRTLPEDAYFFILAGSETARLVSPLLPANDLYKGQALRAIEQMRAFGGTRLSRWLWLALDQFRYSPTAIRQVLLLTDGQNDANDTQALHAAVADCQGAFRCDCCGLGTACDLQELRAVASRLSGTAEMITTQQLVRTDFSSVFQMVSPEPASEIFLRLWTPTESTLSFCKEITSETIDYTPRARIVSPQIREYPTGLWTPGDSRDFHLCFEVQSDKLGQQKYAGIATVLCSKQGSEVELAEAQVMTAWAQACSASNRIRSAVEFFSRSAEAPVAGRDEARVDADLITSGAQP